jgi:hypothetical protein
MGKSEAFLFNDEIYKRYPNGKSKAHRYYFTKWYKCNGKPKEKYLHIAIWEHYYGSVPNGHVVHHVDFNPLNNDILNLIVMEAQDHRDLHRLSEPVRILDCIHCHKSFSTIVNFQKYCSYKCQQMWHYYNNKEKYGKKVSKPKKNQCID